jgi:hypothetical protein
LIRRLLIANLTLNGRTGTEIVTRDLACGLAARGHDVTVFAPALGPIAEEIRDGGVRVTADLTQVHPAPDIVQGHHVLETLEALERFPSARGIFVCHDRRAAHSIPPAIDRIRKYVAVDLNCLERLVGDWSIPEARTQVILNAVNTGRFQPHRVLPIAPARALVFSNYASSVTHTDVIREACRQAGLAVDVVGSNAGTQVSAPEKILGDYDIVFAKARCAIEAMASGAAVILCDATGSGPMVTLAEFQDLRRWNFGARTLQDALDPDTLVRQVRRYDPADAARVTQAIREQSSLDQALAQYEALYEEVMRDPIAPAVGVPVLRQVIEPLTARLHSLEAELAGYRQPERMPALSDDAIAAIRLTLEDAPSSMRTGASAFARVRLHNGLASKPLGSWPPYPLHWAYRWRPIDAAEFPDHECPRMLVRPPVAPGSAEGFAVKVIAPRESGRYVLRITLVQDQMLWLDQSVTPVYRDAEVLVTAE